MLKHCPWLLLLPLHSQKELQRQWPHSFPAVCRACPLARPYGSLQGCSLPQRHAASCMPQGSPASAAQPGCSAAPPKAAAVLQTAGWTAAAALHVCAGCLVGWGVRGRESRRERCPSAPTAAAGSAPAGCCWQVGQGQQNTHTPGTQQREAKESKEQSAEASCGLKLAFSSSRVKPRPARFLVLYFTVCRRHGGGFGVVSQSFDGNIHEYGGDGGAPGWRMEVSVAKPIRGGLRNCCACAV